MAKKKHLVFFSLVLALLLPPWSARSRGLASDAEVLSSEKSSLEALWALEDGQTLRLGVREVKLNATVAVAASHVVIRGIPAMTTVHCPPGDGAFVIKGLNVTLASLNISDCRIASAVRIERDPVETPNSGATEINGLGSDTTDSEEQQRTAIAVRDCLFQRNRAMVGAAVRASLSRVAIVNTTFVHNEAAQAGGAVYALLGEVEVEASTFKKCSVKSGNGGAMHVVRVRKLTVSQSLFNGNSALCGECMLLGFGNGGGISAENCPRVTVTESTFLDNRGGMNAGGVACLSCNVTIRGSAFLNNNADVLAGGVYAGFGGEMIVSESTFLNNRVAGFGGGVFAEGLRTVMIRESTFLNNSVTHYGGGADLRTYDGVSIRESTFLNNSAGMVGGGATVFTNGNVTIRESNFSNNKAEESGDGVLVTAGGNVTIKESIFSNNTAEEHGGGVLVGADGNVTIRESIFSNNIAEEHGGGVCVEERTDTSVVESTFQKNSAQRGGALFSIFATLISNSTIMSNIAKEGGGGMKVENEGSLTLSNTTLRNNRAPFGGAIGLSAGASMPLCYGCEESLIQGNVAFRGGGIFCQACRMDWRYAMRFVENVAVESGGGIYAEDSPAALIPDSTFARNVATFGGGVASADNTRLNLRGIHFEENLAIEGGGLYISSKYGRAEEYIIWISKFVKNRALSLEQMGNLSQQIPTVFKWLKERNEILSRGEQEWLRQETYLQGRVGGMFILLKNKREDSSVRLKMSNLSIENNSALTGGGIYVDNEVLIDGKLGDCGPSELLIRSCLETQFEEITLINNTALAAGGGAFLHVMDNASRYGIQEETLLPTDCDDKSYGYTMCYHNNRVLSDDGSGYGPQIATCATSMEFLNVDGPLTGLTAGERLAVFNEDGGGNSVAGEDIQLILRDAFGRRTSGETVDSGLTFELHSRWISGKRLYRPVNGTVTINETYVAGYNISDTLLIKPSDGRKLAASAKFSTLPCPDGEMSTKSKTECYRCPAHSSTFSASKNDMFHKLEILF